MGAGLVWRRPPAWFPGRAVSDSTVSAARARTLPPCLSPCPSAVQMHSHPPVRLYLQHADGYRCVARIGDRYVTRTNLSDASERRRDDRRHEDQAVASWPCGCPKRRSAAGVGPCSVTGRPVSRRVRRRSPAYADHSESRCIIRAPCSVNENGGESKPLKSEPNRGRAGWTRTRFPGSATLTPAPCARAGRHALCSKRRTGARRGQQAAER